MLTELLAFLAPVALLLSSLGWGGGLLRLMRFSGNGAAENFLFTSLMGLGAVGCLLFFFGSAGLFYSGLLWGILVIGLFLAASYPREGVSWKGLLGAFRPLGFFSRVFLALGALTVLLTLVRVNVPAVTADEVSYHLHLPKIFLLKQAVFYWPFHVNSAFPLLTELLYSYGVSLSSDFATKGVHFLFGILSSLAVYALAREMTPGIPAGWAAALFLSVPVVSHQMGLANNDLALTAYLASGYVAIFKWEKERKKEEWLVFAGVLSGFAMGVKYLALFGAAVQTLLILAICLVEKEPARKIVKSLFVFGLSLLFIGGVWYLRSYLHIGNPFYPYLTSFFGGEGLENPLELGGKGFGKDLPALALLPWNATFYPEAFGGTSNQWGPIFLAFLPWVFWVKLKGKGWKYLLGILSLTSLLWFYTKQNLRFLLPALPFFCIAAAAVLNGLSERGKEMRFAARGMFLTFVGIHLGIAAFHLRDEAKVAFGMERRGDYLLRREPSYEAAKYLNERFGNRGKVLSMEHRAFYFDGEAVRERAYRRLSRYDLDFAGRERELYEKLVSEGFTHLLILKSPFTEPVPFIDEFIRKSGIDRKWENPVYQYRFRDSDSGGERSYSLYQLVPLTPNPLPPKGERGVPLPPVAQV